MSDITNEQQNKKQRLGRGLGSLLGGAGSTASSAVSSGPAPAHKVLQNNGPGLAASAATSAGNGNFESRVWQLQVEKLIPSKMQPRVHFEKEKLEELAASIRQHGIMQPIVARRTMSGAFEIIAGERRWRAAQMAGLHEVPVIIKALSNKETLELAIIENIQREDLNPIEESEAFQRLMTEFKLTQQEAADRVGKDRASVANALRLLSLPIEVREMIRTSKLSAGHGKVLLSLQSTEEMLSLAKKAQNTAMSVRKLEAEIAKLKKSSANQSAESTPLELEKIRAVASLQDQLQKALGTKVEIDYKKGKGQLSLSFYSDAELNAIVEKIRKACEEAQ